MVFEGKTKPERQRFDTRLYKRYKYTLTHYLRYLERLSLRLKLEKKLTFNVARHSWATLAATPRGVPVAVISARTGTYFRKDHADLPGRIG